MLAGDRSWLLPWPALDPTNVDAKCSKGSDAEVQNVGEEISLTPSF